MAVNLTDIELLVQNIIEPLPEEYQTVTFEVTANTVFIEIHFKNLPDGFDLVDVEILGDEISSRIDDLQNCYISAKNGFYRFDGMKLRMFYTHDYCV